MELVFSVLDFNNRSSLEIALKFNAIGMAKWGYVE